MGRRFRRPRICVSRACAAKTRPISKTRCFATSRTTRKSHPPTAMEIQMIVKGFFDNTTNELLAYARNRSEFEAASDVFCSGFKEDNAIVRDMTPDELVANGIYKDCA